MKKVLLAILFLSLCIAYLVTGCHGNRQPVTPPDPDTEHPVWDNYAGISSVVPGNSSVNVHWGTSTDIASPPASYLIFMDTDDNPWDQIPIIQATNKPYTFASLINGNTYWFGVRCQDGANPPNIDTNINVLSAIPFTEGDIPDTQPPIWDSTIGITNVLPGNHELTLNWGTATDTSSPPVRYLLYMDNDDNPWDQIPIYLYSNEQYTFYELINGQTYWFGVRCSDSANPENIDANFVVLSAKPLLGDAPDVYPPVWDDTIGITRTETDGDQVTVYYGSATDVDTPDVWYLLYMDSDNDPWDKSPVVRSSASSYTFKGLERHTYWFGVRCRDSASPPNIDSNIIVLAGGKDDQPPIWDDIVGIADIVEGNGEVTVYWGTATDEQTPPVEYLIFKDSDDYPWDQVYGIASTNEPTTFTGLFDGETCWFAVRCQDNCDPPNIDTNEVVISVTPTLNNRGWARIWGNDEEEETANGVVIDSSGNVYVTGKFISGLDFNPGQDEDWHQGNGWEECYLSKFDSNGNFIYAYTWGSTKNDVGIALAVDTNDNIYVTGYFMQTVDFDPGIGEHYVSSDSSLDAFISKFDSNGNFLWVRHWGYAIPSDIAVDIMGNISISGIFKGSVDFDPGPDEERHVSTSWYDCFLSKFDSSGNLLLARAWGGETSEECVGIASDNSGNTYITGNFRGVVDFDPGPGIEEHCSSEVYSDDVFVSKFDSTGEFEYVLVWGGAENDSGRGIVVDSTGSIFVTGQFIGEVDFDPGPGIELHGFELATHVFLSKFSENGTFDWVQTWRSGSGYVSLDYSGNIFVTGSFDYTRDFDPGPGEDWHTAAEEGAKSAYLSKFDGDGNYQWVRTWGSSQYQASVGIVIDNDLNIIIPGHFQGFSDLDPGTGYDPHYSESIDAYVIKLNSDGYY